MVLDGLLRVLVVILDPQSPPRTLKAHLRPDGLKKFWFYRCSSEQVCTTLIFTREKLWHKLSIFYFDHRELEQKRLFSKSAFIHTTILFVVIVYSQLSSYKANSSIAIDSSIELLFSRGWSHQEVQESQNIFSTGWQLTRSLQKEETTYTDYK
jgi:hypothetical protein